MSDRIFALLLVDQSALTSFHPWNPDLFQWIFGSVCRSWWIEYRNSLAGPTMRGSLLWSLRARGQSIVDSLFHTQHSITLTRVSAPISGSACGSSASRLKWPLRKELVMAVSSSVSMVDGLSTMYLETFPRMRLPISPSAPGEISIMWPSRTKRVMNCSLSNWSYWVS